MIWIAPTDKDSDHAAMEKRPRHVADRFHGNSGVIAQKYFGSILGTSFLHPAEDRFPTESERRQGAWESQLPFIR
jgi:hypothetical protein